MTSNNTPDNDLLFHKLNQETGKINWSELQRHFARGIVIVVDPDLDLVKIAEQISEDQDEIVKSLLDAAKISRATDEDAIRWNKHNQDFWAIVIAPWVLVQEI
ncbi:DUF2288 domain-containing protein [Kaarinaea lacus]